MNDAVSPQPAGRQEPGVRSLPPAHILAMARAVLLQLEDAYPRESVDLEAARAVCAYVAGMRLPDSASVNVEPAPQADAVAFDPWGARERADAAFSPQAIAAAPIATCKTSGMGLCEAREEGGSFCPGGRCLRYDAAVSPQPGPGELSDEQIDEVYSRHWPRTKVTPALRAAARECVALLRSQHAVQADAVQELRNIVEAKRFDRERFDDDTAFADWAQSRGRHTLAAMAGESRPSKGEGT